MNDAPCIRILQDPPRDGPTNMARDEALLTCVGAKTAPPTLRLYQWDPPAISLGYFQRFADLHSLPAPAGALCVVRRLTGGGAILHDQELTYALTLPLDHPLLSEGANRLYEVAHDAIISALGELGVTTARDGESDDSTPTRGPLFCFARRHALDVLQGDDKVAGSAQRRTRDAVLQHGSIILASRFDVQPTVRLPELDVPSAVSQLRATLATQLARITCISIHPAEWATEELAAADRLRPKYAGNDWTMRV